MRSGKRKLWLRLSRGCWSIAWTKTRRRTASGTESIKYTGTGHILERGETSHTLETTSDVTGDALKEAMEDISAAMAHIADEKPVCTVAVKREPGEEPLDPIKKFYEGDLVSKTFESLQKNPRMVLRNSGDTIVTIKTMSEHTQDVKYTEALHADISKLLPRFRSHYNTLEK